VSFISELAKANQPRTKLQNTWEEKGGMVLNGLSAHPFVQQ
jgi:hypothetical protein